jgi:hypothetical protein
MPYGSNRIIRFCGWWLEFFGTKLYMWAISYCHFRDCILFFFVHLSTDSFIPGAKGGTSIFSDLFFFAVPSNAFIRIHISGIRQCGFCTNSYNIIHTIVIQIV